MYFRVYISLTKYCNLLKCKLKLETWKSVQLYGYAANIFDTFFYKNIWMFIFY